MTGVFLKLRDGFADAAGSATKQAPVDARLIPTLAFALLLVTAETAYIAGSELTFPAGQFARVFGLLVFVFVGGMTARHYGMTRIGEALQATAFTPIFGGLSVVAMVILTRFTTSFSDDTLMTADRALGLDWIGMFHFFQHHPDFLEIARLAYLSFYWQLLVVGMVLFASGRQGQGYRFLNAWMIALVISVLIYPFFTAEGPYIRFGIVPADIPNLHRDSPWTTGPIIEAIREGRRTDVIGSMTGLIFFPSFHAAGAVMFIRAWWQFRWLRWLALPLNLLLIAAAPVFGLHYFIDLIGGIAVALVSILAGERLTRRLEQRAVRNGERAMRHIDSGS